MAKLGQYNLDEMTAQETFEASAIHLLEQSKTSRKDYDDMNSLSCIYEGHEGICCAAAIFIQGYNKSMEGKTWVGLVNGHNQTKKHSTMVQQLQRVHDTEAVRGWISGLYEVAKQQSLDTTFLNGWHYNENTKKYEKSE